MSREKESLRSNVWEAQQSPKIVTLTDQATVAIDAALGNVFRVTLGDNRALGEPTNPVDGQVIQVIVVQDGTGGRTLSYNAVFKFTTDIPSPTLSTAANAIDMLAFRYLSTNSKWNCIGVSKGY